MIQAGLMKVNSEIFVSASGRRQLSVWVAELYNVECEHRADKPLHGEGLLASGQYRGKQS